MVTLPTPAAPDVSIVIVTARRPERLLRCLEAVVAGADGAGVGSGAPDDGEGWGVADCTVVSCWVGSAAGPPWLHAVRARDNATRGGTSATILRRGPCGAVVGPIMFMASPSAGSPA